MNIMFYIKNNKKCFPMDINIASTIKTIPTVIDMACFVSDYYCKYVITKGKNKNNLCGRRKYKNREFCFEHHWNVKNREKKIYTEDLLLFSIDLDVFTKSKNKIKKYNKEYINNMFYVKDIKKLEKSLKFNDKYYEYSKDISKIEYNLLNNYYYPCRPISEITIIDKPLLIKYYNDNHLFKNYLKRKKKNLKKKIKKKEKKKIKNNISDGIINVKEFTNKEYTYINYGSNDHCYECELECDNIVTEYKIQNQDGSMITVHNVCENCYTPISECFVKELCIKVVDKKFIDDYIKNKKIKYIDKLK